MKEVWDFFWEQVIPIVGLKNFAIFEFLTIAAILAITKYYSNKEDKSYSQELAIKDSTIQSLRIEIENLKQYPVDVLVQNLSQRTKVLTEELERLNNEVETENRKGNLIEQEKAEIQTQLDVAQSDAIALKQRLEPLEKELDDLLGEMAEPDYCEVCDPDEEHIMLNTISWGLANNDLVGDTALVEKQGVCFYCNSTNLKCKVCGSITGIDDNSRNDTVECEGGCGTLYTLLSFFGDKSIEHAIKVSRIEGE